MSTYDYDLFVFGAGSAGVRAARIAASHGARAAICEHSRVGGTCVIRGCVPKKLLAYASHFAEDFEDAEGFGWTVPVRQFSWPGLIAAKNKEIDRLNRVYLTFLEESGVDLYPQRGRFVDPHRVQVGDHLVSAEHILIATGSHPWTPDIPGRELAITSDDAFELAALPQKIAIVGGGYIACEFASIFNGLGSDVIQIYRGGALLRGFDSDVRRTVGQEMQKKGVNLVFERTVERIEKTGEGLEVWLNDGSSFRVEQVMFATGRIPTVADLALENCGLEPDSQGAIKVDANSRTRVPHVYAVGDVTDRVKLTPVAIYEGHAFADSVFGGRPRPVSHEYVPSAVFCQPPVGTVGFTESDAEAIFGELEVYRSDFRPLKHTLSGRDERTMMKLIVAKDTQKVVGIHIVGMDAPEIVQGFAVAVKSGLTKNQFDATIGIHPTAAEELVTMRTPIIRNGQG